MTLFQLSDRFYNNQIRVRLSENLSDKRTLILGLPGGPGLSSDYMATFLLQLGSAADCVVGLADLPNHDDSSLQSEGLTYKDTADVMATVIKEIGTRSSGVILVGHSFGARVALDALCRISGFRLIKYIGIACPAYFRRSTAFEKKYKELFPSSVELPDEAAFRDYWKKLLPLYFGQVPHPKLLATMAEKTCWLRNSKMLDDAPDLSETVAALSLTMASHRAVDLLTFVQGSDDLVLPDNNPALLQGFFPGTNTEMIPASGHFPMFENKAIFQDVMIKCIR